MESAKKGRSTCQSGLGPMKIHPIMQEGLGGAFVTPHHAVAPRRRECGRCHRTAASHVCDGGKEPSCSDRWTFLSATMQLEVPSQRTSHLTSPTGREPSDAASFTAFKRGLRIMWGSGTESPVGTVTRFTICSLSPSPIMSPTRSCPHRLSFACDLEFRN